MAYRNVRNFLPPDPSEFIGFEWRVDNIQGPCVVISAAQVRDRSTFYGSPPNTPLILRREEVADIPHDLVHMLYSLEPERRVPDSMLTPDVLYQRPDGGFNALEIATRRSLNQNQIHQAIDEKLKKYGDLVDQRKLAALNVLVVTPVSVTLAFGQVTRWAEIQILNAYRFGRAIQEGFWAVHGEDDRDADVRLERLREKFSTFKFSDERFNLREAPRPADIIHLRHMTYKNPFKTFDEYLEDHSEGVHKRTVCHLPMVLVDSGTFNSRDFAVDYPDHPMADIWLKGLADTSFESAYTFEDLKARSEYNDGEKQKVSKELLQDEFRMDLPPDLRAYLSLRGVMAKEMKSKTLDAKREDDKQAFSSRASTDYIDAYFNSKPSEFESHFPESDLLDFMMDPVGPKNLLPVFRRLLKNSLIVRSRVLEMIAVEAVSNCARNPKDNGDYRNFIIRPLLGLKAAVMIRTTRASDLEGKIFCSLLWEGPDDFAEGIYERPIEWSKGKWMTEFFCISREEASQLQGLPSRLLCLWAYLVETFTQNELSPYTTADDFYGVFKQLLWLALIFLSDKQETSELLMSFRYYYMHLLTGTEEAISEAQKVTNKWPEILRNPLSVHIVKNLRNAHSSLKLENCRVLRTQDKVSSSGDDEDNPEEPTIPTTDLLEAGIPSFTGLTIKTANQLLHFAYLGNLKNKDKGSSIAGIMKILNKSAKIGSKHNKMYGLKSKHSDYMSQSTDPLTLKDFQHSGPAVSLGCDLIKKRLMKIHTINDWEKYAERELLTFALNTTLADLCSNKASTIPFDDSFTIKIDDVEQDLKGFGVRQRVYAALYKMVDQLKEPTMALNLEVLCWEMDVNEGGKLQVTMFRKNQIGGVREIYVLTFIGRSLVRIYSDFYRKIASLHPSEKLTNEQSRDYFVAEHMRSTRETLKNLFKKHINISADMTSWAQLFTMMEFATMNACLLPKRLRAFGDYVLSLERDKSIQLPREAARSFCNSFIRMSKGEHVELSSDGSESLRKQFLGMEEGLIDKAFSPYFHLQNDMMMGILHYTSTVYHLAQLEVLESCIKTWAYGRGCQVTTSFQVSSDDEGIMVTLGHDDPKKVAWRQKQFMDEYHSIKSSVDKLFGLKTSYEKTSISMQPIFEFNSKFNLGQTIVSPLIKFITRCMDDNAADSLHKRVSGLYTSVKAVRENGGTGYLSHFVMIAQAMMYCSHLGLGRAAWARPDIYKTLWQEKVSYLGYYQILNPFCAGIMGLNYSNWLSCDRDPNATNICFHLGSYAIPDDSDALDTVMFGIANVNKYKGILRELGLEGVKMADLITEDNIESLLRKSATHEEEKLKLKKIILSPGMATSLGQRTRSDVMRQSIFLLFTAFCREKEGESKVSLHTFREKLLRRPLKGDLRAVFPMFEHFQEVRRIVSSPYAVAIKDRRQRTRIHWLSSQYTISDAQKDIKDVLRWKWFNLSVRLTATQLKAYWLDLKMSIPWLRSTLKDTIGAPGYPFKNLYQMLSFFEGYSKSAFPQKMIVRGILGRSLHPVLDLMRDNTSESCSFVVSTLSEIIPAGFYRKIDFGLLQRSMEFEDRTSAWLELLNQVNIKSDHQVILDTMYTDVQEMGKTVKWEKFVGVSTGQSDHDESLWRIALSSGVMTSSDYFKQSRYCTLYVEPQSRNDDGTYHGDYESYRRVNGIPFHLIREGKITKVFSPVDEFTAAEMLGKLYNPVYIRQDVGDIPSVYFSSIVVHRNAWYFKGRTTHHTLYLSLPRGSPQPHHMKLKYNQNAFLELWLSRQKPEGDAWKSYMDLYNTSPLFVKAINLAVDGYYRSSRIRRIFERSGPKIEPEETKMTDDDILKLADDLMDTDQPPLMEFPPTKSFAEIMEQEEQMEESHKKWYEERIQEFVEDFAEEYAIDDQVVDEDQFQENYEERYVPLNLMNEMYKTMHAMQGMSADTPDDLRSMLQQVLLYK